MEGYSLLLALIGTTLLYHGWRERRDENRRDARLLNGLAMAAMAGSATVLFA